MTAELQGGSADEIVLEIKLPVPVTELVAITDALCKIHGDNALFMRQVGQMLQFYKLRKKRICKICVESEGEHHDA